MVHITSITLIASIFAGFVSAAPLRVRQCDVETIEDATTSTNSGAFQLLDYVDFQISTGNAGEAEAKANAIFVDPFDGTDLATLDEQVVKDMETMRQAAEAAEVDLFNPAIDAAADGTTADILQVGKIQNKVLKLVAECQVLNIKIAQAAAAGDDTTDLVEKLAEEEKKRDTNIAIDVASSGAASLAVV